MTKPTRPRKTGRPSVPGQSVYVRLRPELRERIDEIHAAETPALGKLSLNETINYLISLGVEKYSENKRDSAN